VLKQSRIIIKYIHYFVKIDKFIFIITNNPNK